MSNLLPFAVLVARELKRGGDGPYVVLGGVGPSPVARRLIEAFPFIDSVVEGEGERGMLSLLRGERERLPPPRIFTDLDQLPIPAYALLDFSLYDAAPSVVTSRGCPYQCTFCTEPYNFAGKVRFRSVDSIIEELELIHGRSGRTVFLFQDDILPLKPSRFRALLAGFRGLSFPMRWKCFSRVDLMTDALMEEMVESGCVQVRYGIESGSNDTLTRIKKGFSIETAYEISAKSVEYFPSVHASFIWGYPSESHAEFEETIDAVDRFEGAGVSVLLFEYAPLPGSPLYQSSPSVSLRFSRDDYSFYVATGHEVCTRGGQVPDGEHDEIYRIIMRHPEIFSGFYRYENAAVLRKRARLDQFEATRRSAVRNEYDL
jgi:radical SAM superfamily enzyme YgiQ (UPF0313 family)